MNPVSKILLGIGLAIVFVVLVAFLYLIIVNAHLKTEVAQTQANATACHLANDDFAAQVAKQNAAIEAIKKQSLAQAVQAKRAEIVAQKQAQLYLKAAAKMKTHIAGKDICASADGLFNDYLRNTK